MRVRQVCSVGETSEALGGLFGAPCAMAVAFFNEDTQAARVPQASPPFPLPY